MYKKIHQCGFYISLQVVGGKMTDAGRLGAFITKVKKGSLADVVGHLRAGNNSLNIFLHIDPLKRVCQRLFRSGGDFRSSYLLQLQG